MSSVEKIRNCVCLQATCICDTYGHGLALHLAVPGLQLDIIWQTNLTHIFKFWKVEFPCTVCQDTQSIPLLSHFAVQEGDAS